MHSSLLKLAPKQLRLCSSYLMRHSMTVLKQNIGQQQRSPASGNDVTAGCIAAGGARKADGPASTAMVDDGLQAEAEVVEDKQVSSTPRTNVRYHGCVAGQNVLSYPGYASTRCTRLRIRPNLNPTPKFVRGEHFHSVPTASRTCRGGEG